MKKKSPRQQTGLTGASGAYACKDGCPHQSTHGVFSRSDARESIAAPAPVGAWRLTRNADGAVAKIMMQLAMRRENKAFVRVKDACVLQ